MTERRMTLGEIALATKYFGNLIDYSKVIINNNSSYFGFPKDRVHVPLDGQIYLSRSGDLAGIIDFSNASLEQQATFIHELVHIWQYETLGLAGYVKKASTNYYYEPVFNGTSFYDMNIEQQAQMVRDYFYLSNGVTFNDEGGLILRPIEEYQALLPKEIRDVVDDLPKPAELKKIANPHCFLAGTSIATPFGDIPIEEIRADDTIYAFSADTQNGTGNPIPSRVSNISKKTSVEIVDIHGVFATMGHMFLTSEGIFSRVSEILMNDGAIVSRDGTYLRARTNMPIESAMDQVVQVSCSAVTTIGLRCGVPYGRLDPDGPIYTLGAKMAHDGYRLRDDGLFENDDGDVKMAEWPWGDPREHPVAHDYVVGEPWEIAAAPVKALN